MFEEKKEFLEILKKIWKFLWHDDSWLSWITFIFLAFIIIKFVFFPSISLIMGTKLPIVIVESCSMYHTGNFEEWWDSNGNWYEQKGINKEQFEKFYLTNGFTKGDIFFVTGIKKENIKLGDIIIFVSGEKNRPIIHRVIDDDNLATKGDHNQGQLTIEMSNEINPERIDETNISQNQIIGKVSRLKIPFLGWVKLIFFEPFRSPQDKGFCR